jgi:hypothetical protein
MKVFLCWSGDRSKAVAELLGHWIGQVIQAVQPWISTQTDKGTRWRQEVGDHLEEARVGIVCLTPENLDETWIHFEAGALSKTKDARVCTFLLGMQSTDIKEPLAQFQATKADETDIRALIKDINKYVGEDGGRALPEKDVDEIFDLHWPRLKEKLQAISDQKISKGPVRKDGEKLDEVLEILRSQEQRMQQFESSQSGLLLFQPGGAGRGAGSTDYFTTVGPTGAKAIQAIQTGEVIKITQPPFVRTRIPKRAEETPIEKEEEDSTKSKE